jgi:uncharacterized cupredoxin-like copper-binding protein
MTPVRLALLLAGGITVAACAPAPPGRAVQIEMTDFAFTPREVTLRSGEVVTLVLKNKGTVPHEIMAGGGEIQHAGGYANDLFAGTDLRVSGDMRPDHQHGGVMILVDRGRTAYATFTVPYRRGVYELGCFEPGHYLAGMFGRLVIE